MTKKDKDPDLDDIIANLDAPDPLEPGATSDIVVAEPADQLAEIESKQDVVGNILQNMIVRYDDVCVGVLSSLKSDRDQIQTVITLLMDELKTDPKMSRVKIEALANLLGTKADTNANAVKLLDSVTKLIAATKTMPMLTVSQSINWAEIQAALDQPEYPDEQRMAAVFDES